jgi:elongation factor Ts
MSLETIKMLRERTGASLQACKKALDESNGDQEKAIEILRKKGESKAASRGDRETNEGVVAIAVEGNKAAILKLNCETDFVAKNPDFVEAADKLAKEYLANGEGHDASSFLNDFGLKMGEKLEIGEIKILEAPTFGNYIHSNLKMGTLVALEGGDDEMARDIAMHVTAMNPSVLSPDEVNEEVVAKEREIWTEQLKNEGKPEEIMDKILFGKEKKFREENALLKQAFVKNPDQTIEQVLGDAQVKGFVRLGA